MRFEPRTSTALTVLIVFSTTCGIARGQACSGQWAEGFTLPGLDRPVYVSVVFNDGSGDALYVGGSFFVVGDTVAANIAKWDGANWSALGTVMGINGSVSALTVFDDGGGPALYAGGNFTAAGGANYIAKWDGANWSALGTGLNSAVTDLTVFDDGGGPALYAGGFFTTAGGAGANRIAKWDGANWSAMGTGMDLQVYSLTVFDDGGGAALYAGGDFSTAGGTGANRIAKWDGANWSALGSGMNGYVYALTVFDDGGGPALYVGGGFTTAGGAGANRIAKWDGANWSALGTGMNNAVLALTVFDNGGGPALYTGGYFTTAGGAGANRIAKWDGANWSALGTGTNDQVRALTVFDDGGGPALYAAGFFTTAGGAGANSISKWDGANWWALGAGAGMNETVSALTIFDDGGGLALYAAGLFTSAGGVSASRIAKWDGANWSPLGVGMNGSVVALTVFDDGAGPALYAGGAFTTAGGAGANRIAKWDGANWSPLGTGMNNIVYALTVFDDGGGAALYAGGDFTTAGGAAANYIAKWDGADWSALGTGMNGLVRALTVFDDGGGAALYAGGDFTTAGGAGANKIAKWDGVNWSALGTGMNGLVRALTVFDDGGGAALYAGGGFTSAGGAGANYIAKWDGADWSALGAGMGNEVYALTVFDDGGGRALYAGGKFVTAGGASANRIAKWDGANWSALGTGIGGEVYALAVFDEGGPALYAGGFLSNAGGAVSANIAKWATTCRLYVDASASGAGAGSSWTDGYNSLQDALAFAAGSDGAVDEMWVANGTYRPDQGGGQTPGDRTATFQLLNGVAIYGGFAGTETLFSQRNPATNTTILSGDLNGDDGPDFANNSENSYHVVTGNGTDATAVLDGVVIRAGNADDTFNWPHNQGGGMLNVIGGPTLGNCIFRNNWAVLGGGAVFNGGGAPTLVNCDLLGNGSLAEGGAMYNNAGSVNLTNCRFVGNVSAWSNGGAMLTMGGSPTLTNCTFSGNAAAGVGGGISSDTSDVTITNCIVWGNSDSAGTGESAQISGSATVSYTCIEGLDTFTGNGNIGGNPLFLRAPNDGGDGWGVGGNDDFGDLRLSSGSPCIDAADTTAVPADVADLDHDGNTSERTPYDLAGAMRAVDDPTTPDTGVPGSHVVDMGAYEYYTDCNRNGLPDGCDLDCDPPAGNCNVPGCGQSVDVNPADGIPDECVPFTGGCAPDADWSCPNNWDIPGEVYPNNGPGQTYSAILDGPGDNVFLDVTVTIDTLDILNGATLSVTQTGTGDLTVVDPGGILLEGTLYVGNDRVITVPNGPVDIGAGGLYQADPSSSGTGCDPGVNVCASLTADSIAIGQGNIAGPDAGTMILDSAMSVTTTGDFVLDGRGAIPCTDVPTRGSSDTPPIVRIQNTAALMIGGDLGFLGSVDVVVDSSTSVELAGNFDNQSLYPACFDCSNGGLVLGGAKRGGRAVTQLFEVAGRDLGPTPNGFGTPSDTNFSMGKVQINPGATVKFANNYANAVGTGPCAEALYVHQLTLGAGSQVTLDNCRVYYDELIPGGATIIPLGCGALIGLCQAIPDPPQDEQPAIVPKNRYLTFVPGNAGLQTALRITLADLPPPFAPLFVGCRLWVGPPFDVSEVAGKGDATPPTFKAARLQTAPHCMDWGTIPQLYVFDNAVVPSGAYEVQAINCSCDFGVEPYYSGTLPISSSKWGDIVGSSNNQPPNNVVDFNDISAVVDKFKNSLGAPMKARADIAPNVPDKIIDFVDIPAVVDAFKGRSYPYAGPDECP